MTNRTGDMVYVESEALVAVLDGDEGQCRELLSGMYPNELHGLLDAISQLRALAFDAYCQARERRD